MLESSADMNNSGLGDDENDDNEMKTSTAHHQQMAKKIENGDFADEYFASLSAPAKRLIEVRIILFFKVSSKVSLGILSVSYQRSFRV